MFAVNNCEETFDDGGVPQAPSPAFPRAVSAAGKGKRAAWGLRLLVWIVANKQK